MQDFRNDNEIEKRMIPTLYLDPVLSHHDHEGGKWY